jgi:transposase
MHQKEMSIREISRLLAVSRNTVRKVLQNDTGPNSKGSKHEDHLGLVRELLSRCRGNVVRVKECLDQEHGISIPYTTLTWMVRSYGLAEPRKERSGRYVFEPGQEMQHDTSPYKLHLGHKRVNAQCASLVLAYSRKLFIQFYPRFTRFEAKLFLSRAFDFLQGVCPRCVVDNTSVIVSHGTGPDAVIAPEMEAFARIYQVSFMPHRVNDPNRKARIERPFNYVFKNFLAGREFRDWNDLNSQALSWCENVANAKTKRSLGMSPESAYLQEKPFLTPLPVHMPEVYRLLYRVVDSEGYVHLETNRYSVPQKLIGKRVEVFMFWDKIQVYARHTKVAEHARVLEAKQARITEPGHHPPLKKTGTGPCREERLLTGQKESLDRYVAELKKRSRGRGAQRMRRLLALKRNYPEEAFLQAIERALHYGMYDLARLEDLILSFIAGDFFEL